MLQTNEESDTARVFIADPPVLAECAGRPEEATEVGMSLVRADVDKREVLFAWPAD